jgi:hypothetical protein
MASSCMRLICLRFESDLGGLSRGDKAVEEPQMPLFRDLAYP